MLKKNIWNLIFILSIFLVDRVSKIAIIESSKEFGDVNKNKTKWWKTGKTLK